MSRWKRYVVGPDEAGRSAVLETEATSVQERPGFFWRATLWATDETPADNTVLGDRSTIVDTREPLAGGMLYRALEIPPDHADADEHRRVIAQLNEDVGQTVIPTEEDVQRHPSMHRTNTLDCITCVIGEIHLVTDVEEVLMTPGDSVVIRGTNHGWKNRSDKPCLLVGVMVDAVPKADGVAPSSGPGRAARSPRAMASPDGPLAEGVEHRLADFTALMTTAFSNTQAREDLRLLADGQAAVRRVATLVAHQSPAAQVFAGVAEEAGRLLGAHAARLIQYEDNGTVTVLATWGELADAVPVGTNTRLEGETAATIVRRTERPVRLDGYPTATGARASYLRERGIRSVVGAPIMVDGGLWGAILVGSLHEEPLSPRTESRVEEFTELVATAIANIQARTDLAASRARIVGACDEERRRVARDLHDGAQSRLVHAVIAFERARARGDLPAEVRPLVEEGLAHARAAIAELRELARGIHPAILTHSGLAAAVDVLADHAPFPVETAIPEERYPTPVESAAYFVAAEALTNVAKYAHASSVRVAASRTPAGLRLVVEDNGVGGATCTPGGGLAGLGDRLAALDGDLVIDSPPGGGTRIRAELPLPD